MNLNFLFEPGSPLVDHLEPFTLIKFLHVCKSARKAAVPKLREIQASPQTLGHSQMFQEWLQSPSFPAWCNNAREIDAVQTRGGTLQKPLRLEAIQNAATRLINNVVILGYKKSYDRESSSVTVFDDEGAFVAFYEFECRSVVHQGDSINRSRCAISMRSSAEISTCRAVNPLRARWEMSDDRSFEWDQDGDLRADVFTFHDAVTSNYALHQIYKHELTTSQVILVLMHALSSDPRAIYCYVYEVFKNTVHHITTVMDETNGVDDAVFEALCDWLHDLYVMN